MAGVYIPGMEMPKSCDYCHVWDCPYDECIDGYTKHDRPRSCPLVPVPPHGKLGDLDALKETIEDLIEKHLHGYTKSTWDFVCELRSIISDAPTIITAEAAEEGSP